MAQPDHYRDLDMVEVRARLRCRASVIERVIREVLGATALESKNSQDHLEKFYGKLKTGQGECFIKERAQRGLPSWDRFKVISDSEEAKLQTLKREQFLANFDPFGITPPMFSLTVQVEGKTCQGSVHPFFEGHTLSDLLMSQELNVEDSVSRIVDIPRAMIHKMIVAEILFGNGSGHIGNYVVSNDGRSMISLDGEKHLMPVNELRNQTDQSYPLVSIRSCILGLPQATQPFDREFLTRLADPAFNEYIEFVGRELIQAGFSEATKETFLQRWQWIFQEAQRQLAQETVTLSPRQFYLQVFHAEQMYGVVTKIKQYCPLLAMNQVIVWPYMKPESAPEWGISAHDLYPLYDRSSQEVTEQKRKIWSVLDALTAAESK